jgi:hypothetical protein
VASIGDVKLVAATTPIVNVMAVIANIVVVVLIVVLNVFELVHLCYPFFGGIFLINSPLTVVIHCITPHFFKSNGRKSALPYL